MTTIISFGNLGIIEVSYYPELYRLRSARIVSYEEAHEVPPKPVPGRPYKIYSLK